MTKMGSSTAGKASHDRPWGLTIRLGLPDRHRAAAARLYWQAFGSKLGHVLGPDARAHAYLLDVMRGDHVLCATLADDVLAGVAGFRSHGAGFVSGSTSDLAMTYGTLGALWRTMALRLIASGVDNERFLIDGIAVRDDLRGHGIGSALIAALCAEARGRGYQELRLDVAENNPRARALYEREGFRAGRRDGIGPLALLFGFRASVQMFRDVD